MFFISITQNFVDTSRVRKMLRNPNYVYGPRDVYIPMRINFGEFMIDTLYKHRKEIAIINETTGEKVTYEQICQEAVNLAVSLTRLGVQKGQAVAICSENRQEVWSSIFGIVCAGAVMTPINTMYTQTETTHVLNISKPSFVICSPTMFKVHEKTFRSLKFIKNIIIYEEEKPLNTVLYNDLARREHIKFEQFEVPHVNGQTDTAFILYSSGTTGLPKGVMLTHLNLIATVSIPPLREAPEPYNPVSISVTPWFHAMGLMFSIIKLAQGKTMVTMNKFDIDSYLKTVEKYKPSRLNVVPPMLVALIKSEGQYDLSSVQYFICGAAPLPKDILSAVKTKFPNTKAILQGYGMTEVTLAISMDHSDAANTTYKPDSIGSIIHGHVVKIADLDTGKALGVRQQGEICVKGITIMKGYIGKDNTDDFDSDGFLKTGDIGYFDEDGSLYIVDRLKELIKYKGNQVAPAEIEAILLQHEAVRDAGVVGIEHKTSGEVPLAFIVTQPGKSVTEKELKDFVSVRLSNPKHLRGGVRFVSEIPKNPSGKILRRQLKMMLKNKSKL